MSKELREKVAKEAARLLYYGYANEYKDAKELASKNLNLFFLPSNYEVALQLDDIASLMEGKKRDATLIKMRHTALKVMKLLEEHKPKLIGSVWRGTIHKKSDIDISLYSENKKKISEQIQKKYTIRKINEASYISEGRKIIVLNIGIRVNEYDVEIVIRDPKDEIIEYCEIFGDIKKGIDVEKLEKLMNRDPLRRYVPKR
jgi:predicted nucleotidyltransferase